ncbi:hypothetical protein ACVWZ6_002450 [Bradyrhizobium sp. GM6.1]
MGYLATTLAAIDLTLAGLFWSFGTDEEILARLLKKTLFVGVFAYLIGNWNSLARIVFESFAGLGLKASGTSLSAADFLRPGRIAQVGLDAGRPILDSISGLMGYVSFFENLVQIVVLLFAWIVVLLAFFILAIQLFVTLVEFKLTTLAGFVLIPFGLFGKTAFAAEASAGQRNLFRRQGPGPGRHCRHRIDLVLAVHGRLRRQPADHRECDGAGARCAHTSGARDFRARCCQRHRLRRSAAWRRKRCRDRPRRRWRCCGWRRSRRRRGRSRRRRDCWRGTWRQRDCKWYDERVAGGEHVRRRGKCVRCG